MPFVSEHDGRQRPFEDLGLLATQLGEPPWRSCLLGTPGLRVVLLHWPPGFEAAPHLHPHADETFQVISGRALFTIGDEPEREVAPGCLVFAKRGVRHSIRVPADGSLILLAAVAPNEDREDEEVDVP
jgi:quercetin dioxygenase-like cupin family protein